MYVSNKVEDKDPQVYRVYTYAPYTYCSMYMHTREHTHTTYIQESLLVCFCSLTSQWYGLFYFFTILLQLLKNKNPENWFKEIGGRGAAGERLDKRKHQVLELGKSRKAK